MYDDDSLSKKNNIAFLSAVCSSTEVKMNFIQYIEGCFVGKPLYCELHTKTDLLSNLLDTSSPSMQIIIMQVILSKL